ncbi:MAG: type II secretion system GspH family protein [Polyangiaceae bacterium]|nr:type II secretion system GspH family protein [Polyangiaceae bacterium]
MMKRTRSAKGFTAVEVLVSMTLFAIGAAGVISMLRVSIQGNADARRFDMATQIAAEWQARLRRDSMAWTTPDAFNNVGNIQNTQFLKDAAILTSPLQADANWLQPLPAAPGTFGTSNAFDILGREIPQGDPATFFCVNYRLDFLNPNNAQALANATSPIRAEVRVFWPRNEQAPPTGCQPPANTTTSTQYHFLYTATVIRRNAT